MSQTIFIMLEVIKIMKHHIQFLSATTDAPLKLPYHPTPLWRVSSTLFPLGEI